MRVHFTFTDISLTSPAKQQRKVNDQIFFLFPNFDVVHNNLVLGESARIFQFSTDDQLPDGLLAQLVEHLPKFFRALFSLLLK